MGYRQGRTSTGRPAAFMPPHDVREYECVRVINPKGHSPTQPSFSQMLDERLPVCNQCVDNGFFSGSSTIGVSWYRTHWIEKLPTRKFLSCVMCHKALLKTQPALACKNCFNEWLTEGLAGRPPPSPTPDFDDDTSTLPGSPPSLSDTE